MKFSVVSNFSAQKCSKPSGTSVSSAGGLTSALELLRHNGKFCLAAVAKEFQFQKQPIPFSQMWQIFGGRERSYAFPFPIDFVDSCGMYCSFFFWFGFVVFSAKLHCTLGDIALYPANAAVERSVIK